MSAAIPLAVAARFLLSFSSLHSSLQHNHLLTSPLNSYPRLQEGLFLYSHGVDPYSGGGFHHSPLLLSLFSTVIPLTATSARVLVATCDALSAYFLVSIWRARSNTSGGTREMTIIGALLLNPYLFLTSLSLSTSPLENTLYLASVFFACRKKKAPCLFALSFLTHLSLNSVLLLPPVTLLLLGSPTSSLASPRHITPDKLQIVRLASEYFLYTAALFLASCLGSDGITWVYKTWGTQILLPDLTPNPGLWWYFFTEMFDHFRPFFLMVFSVHLLIYVAPVCIKFQHDPLYATFLLQGIFAIFKPYPTMADIGLFLSCISLFPEIYQHFRHPIVTALLHLHAALLLPLFHSLWLTQGTGNANFFYASTLVFGMANGAAVVDCVYAGLRIAFPVRKGFEIAQE
ncbi:PIG-U-domain-containing protein [Fomitiporia mediterranea MF3/22]|uniref:PIG-U-domain-containing protein n=1 Tax=Fomitiporia mediterranea (strain MF3/22) TaxID=694068 RepID=UPI0004407556|nr:PIG-U-domain-containing protein [Fomitiporia mediterranea MF3/22]EJD02819.1 PIG-U-domain-containing protein [Fomitiporia mediterranea MF3/22]